MCACVNWYQSVEEDIQWTEAVTGNRSWSRGRRTGKTVGAGSLLIVISAQSQRGVVVVGGPALAVWSGVGGGCVCGG